MLTDRHKPPQAIPCLFDQLVVSGPSQAIIVKATNVLIDVGKVESIALFDTDGAARRAMHDDRSAPPNVMTGYDLEKLGRWKNQVRSPAGCDIISRPLESWPSFPDHARARPCACPSLPIAAAQNGIKEHSNLSNNPELIKQRARAPRVPKVSSGPTAASLAGNVAELDGLIASAGAALQQAKAEFDVAKTNEQRAVAQVAADARALASLRAAVFDAENRLSQARSEFADAEKTIKAAALETEGNSTAAEAVQNALVEVSVIYFFLSL